MRMTAQCVAALFAYLSLSCLFYVLRALLCFSPFNLLLSFAFLFYCFVFCFLFSVFGDRYCLSLCISLFWPYVHSVRSAATVCKPTCST